MEAVGIALDTAAGIVVQYDDDDGHAAGTASACMPCTPRSSAVVGRLEGLKTVLRGFSRKAVAQLFLHEGAATAAVASDKQWT